MIGLISFGIAVLVLYIIGVINQYRTTKTWLIPSGRYFSEICRAMGLVALAITGQKTPRNNATSADTNYAPLDPFVAEEALRQARETMISLGITYTKAYKPSQFDCEDFAMVMKGLATYYASKILGGDKVGIPYSLFAYVRRDKAGKLTQPHVDLRVETTEGYRYCQPYPEHVEPVEIDEEELNSMDWIFT